MKIERLISWFSLDTGSFAGEINIDYVDLDILINIFNPSREDPLMYYPYDINKNIARELNKYIDLNFEFKKYTYQLDCFQIDLDTEPSNKKDHK
jgi:hypothetical protein